VAYCFVTFLNGPSFYALYFFLVFSVDQSQNSEEISKILSHPKCGASWEGYALENLIHSYDNDIYDFYFWATEKGAELDLLVMKGDRLTGYEFKYSEAPKTTKSMHIAMEDLKLDHLTIVMPGERSYPLTQFITFKNLKDALSHE